VTQPYDAVLLVSFGGPERPDHVTPFLENVTRGKDVPKSRILQVGERYHLFGGVSPVNAQNRAILAALVAELNAHGPRLPVYWGNRFWHPLLRDALEQMAGDGVRRAVAFVTSAFGSYPSCGAYLDDIRRAREAAGPDPPEVDKLPLFYNHPGFIEAVADRAATALEQVPAGRRGEARIVYTVHSIPVSMAAVSPYEAQVHEACRLVSKRLDRREWGVAYQSRSGRPADPWLEPDLSDLLRRFAGEGKVRDVVIVPIGFVSENMEVVYDLDVAAAELCDQLGLNMVRSAVVGAHPRFVAMIRELIQQRIEAPTAEDDPGGRRSPTVCRTCQTAGRSPGCRPRGR
jgi:ferrochelatase